MTKLKFDRSINLKLSGSEISTIPMDEVWKVTLNRCSINGYLVSAYDTNRGFAVVATLGGY